MDSPLLSSKPNFRNLDLPRLMRYRLPWPGRVSILHRASGALLFLALPWMLFLLDRSLVSESTFAKMSDYAGHWLVKLGLLVLIWAFLHHLCAGIRFLALDLHIGFDKASASKSALAALIASLALTAIAALRLYGVL
jgi:succinate dehydrogenase / fumarate reductase cytochrome b subunit